MVSSNGLSIVAQKPKETLFFLLPAKGDIVPLDCKRESKVSWLKNLVSKPVKKLATVSFDENGDGSDHQVGGLPALSSTRSTSR